MLSNMTADEEEKYLQAIANEDPELHKEIKKYHLTFDDIIEKFPSDILRGLLNAVELDQLAVKGVDQEKVDELVEMLPQKKQAMFEPVEKPLPKREVDTARKVIVGSAKQLEESGEVNLADILGGGEMVE